MLEVLKQALEALEYIDNVYMSVPKLGHEAITSLRKAIAELESQEPVAWVNKERNTITWDKLYPDMDALYTHPPQRKEQEHEALQRIAEKLRRAGAISLRDKYKARLKVVL